MARGLAVIGDQALEVQAFDLTINHPPLTRDHHSVCPVRAAQQQCGNGVMAAGEAQLIELEQCQVRLLADGQLANVCAPQQLRRALGGPAQHAFRGDLFCAITQALDVQGLARFEDHI